MTNEPQITLIGNLTGDPELRFIQSGAAVVNFTVAQTPRTFDRKTNEWKDGETLFMRCSLWREAAENAAETLTKGMRVIVTGVLKSKPYEKDGERRSSMELEVDEVGPSLKYATAKVERKGSKPSTVAAASAGYAPPAPSTESDPWANVPGDDSPPF